MSSEKDKSGVELSLAELAERSGTPGRTIRFYIARGLLAGPFKAGRGASYGEAHLARLAEIREWQEKGLTQEAVIQVPAGTKPASVKALPPP